MQDFFHQQYYSEGFCGFRFCSQLRASAQEDYYLDWAQKPYGSRCLGNGLFHPNVPHLFKWVVSSQHILTFFPLGEITEGFDLPSPFSNSPLQRRIDPLVHPGWGVSERAWLSLMNWNPGEIFPSRVCLSWKSMGSMHVSNEKSTVSTPLFPSIRSSKSNLINLTFASQSRRRETFFPGGDRLFLISRLFQNVEVVKYYQLEASGFVGNGGIFHPQVKARTIYLLPIAWLNVFLPHSSTFYQNQTKSFEFCYCDVRLWLGSWFCWGACSLMLDKKNYYRKGDVILEPEASTNKASFIFIKQP